MKKKRVLAMVLAMSMMFSQSVFASEPEQTPQEENAVVLEEEQTPQEENGVVSEEEQEQINEADVLFSEEEQTQSEEENGVQSAEESESEEAEFQEQTYYTGEATEKHIVYLNYPVIFSTGLSFGTTYELSFSDDSICSGSMVSIYCKLEGLKEGTTTLSIKDSEGNVVKTVEVEVKAELPEDAVVIKDLVLRSQLLITKDFGDDGYISYNEMSQLTSLVVLSSYGGTAVEDLSGFEYADNLESLSLSDTGITDISALSNLTNLESLDLSNTEITDISALSNLINLGYLDLSNTEITDIGALGNLTDLEDLYLDNTGITDISALSNLINLKYLYLKKCGNLTSIQSLYGLNNLKYLYLSSTQVPDEEKLEMMKLQNDNLSMVKGETKIFPAPSGMLESTDTFCVEVSGGDTESAEVINYSTNKDEVLAKEKGTVQLTLHLNETEKEITINIDGISAEQEVGENVGLDVENFSEQQEFATLATILTSNGDLWRTYPEVEKLRSNVTKYVSQWVYSGADAFLCDYSLDKNGELWSGDIKIAENIKDMEGHYALSEDNVLIDIYNDDSIQIEDVKTWIEFDDEEVQTTYILKNDGSLWVREEVEKSAEVNEFQKIADNVVLIRNEGYLLMSGEFLTYSGRVIATNVESLPAGYYDGYNYGYYYGKDGNCYICNSAGDINIGEYELKECLPAPIYTSGTYTYTYYYLTVDGELYFINEDREIELIEEGVAEITWKIVWGYGSSGMNSTVYYYLTADGKLYSMNKDREIELIEEGVSELLYHYIADKSAYDTFPEGKLSEIETMSIQSAYYNNDTYNLVVNCGEDYGIVERNGIAVLNSVKKIWGDVGGAYALRTDGTIWKISGIPELYIDLNSDEAPVQSGDLNGDDSINITDLMMCLYYVSGRTELDSNALAAADVNGDGAVTIIDLMRILYYVSGRNATL